MARSVLLATASDLLAVALETLVRRCPGDHRVSRSRDLDSDADVVRNSDVVVLDAALVGKLGRTATPIRLVRTIVLAVSPGVGLVAQQAAGFACAMIRPVTPLLRIHAILETVVPCGRQGYCEALCLRCPARSSIQPERLPLSAREQEIFGHIGSGRGPTEISRSLGLSVKTIEAYQASIKRKLGLRTRMELIDSAARWCRGELSVGGDNGFGGS